MARRLYEMPLGQDSRGVMADFSTRFPPAAPRPGSPAEPPGRPARDEPDASIPANRIEAPVSSQARRGPPRPEDDFDAILPGDTDSDRTGALQQLTLGWVRQSLGETRSRLPPGIVRPLLDELPMLEPLLNPRF